MELNPKNPSVKSAVATAEFSETKACAVIPAKALIWPIKSPGIMVSAILKKLNFLTLLNIMRTITPPITAPYIAIPPPRILKISLRLCE